MPTATSITRGVFQVICVSLLVDEKTLEARAGVREARSASENRFGKNSSHLAMLSGKSPAHAQGVSGLCLRIARGQQADKAGGQRQHRAGPQAGPCRIAGRSKR